MYIVQLVNYFHFQATFYLIVAPSVEQNLWLVRYAFLGLMIVIATRFFPLSPQAIVTVLCWKAARGFERILSGVLVNSFPNNKILDLSKLEAFADDKIYVT